MSAFAKVSDRSIRFANLVREHGGKAVYYALRLSRNHADAQDIVQEALSKVWENLDRYDGRQPLKPLFFVVLRNCFVDHYRQGRSRMRFAGTYQNGHNGDVRRGSLPRFGVCLLNEAIRSESIQIAQATLNDMKPHHKAVVTLCDLEGEKYREAARKLKVPIGTIRSRVHRARKSLRKRMLEWEGT